MNLFAFACRHINHNDNTHTQQCELHTIARSPIPSEARVTGAEKVPHHVGACGVGVAVVRACLAFVNVYRKEGRDGHLVAGMAWGVSHRVQNRAGK